MLHFAVEHNMENMVDALFTKHDIDANITDAQGITPLLVAMCKGHARIAKRLVDITKDVNAKDAKGRTALLIATENDSQDYRDIAEALLKKGGIDPNIVNDRGMTPLLFALQHSNASLAQKLLTRTDIRDLNKQDEEGRSAFFLAVYNCHHSMASNWEKADNIVDILLANNDVDVSAKDKSGSTPLLEALSRNNVAGAIALLARKDITNLDAKRDGMDALGLAAKNGYKDVVDALLAKENINLHEIDKQGTTPLMHAILNRHVSIAKKLLSKKDVNVLACDGTGESALTFAAYYGLIDILDSLLLREEMNEKAINITDKDGNTPLCLAVHQNRFECAERLLATGKADTNIPNKAGNTALNLAAQKQKNIKLLSSLLDHGANVDAADSNGNTLLIYGVTKNNRAMVRVALQHGADLNHANKDGDTALMAAEDNLEMINYLLEEATPTAAFNECINEAFVNAAAHGNDEVVKLLHQHGADLNYISKKTGMTALETAFDRNDKSTIKILKDFRAAAAKPVTIEAKQPQPTSLLRKHSVLNVTQNGPASLITPVSLSAEHVNDVEKAADTGLRM